MKFNKIMNEIINLDTLKVLFSDFYKVTSIQVSLFSTDLKEIYNYPHDRSLENHLLDGNVALQQKISKRHCDAIASIKEAKSKNTEIIKISPSQYMAVSAITLDGVILGYLVLGDFYINNTFSYNETVADDRVTISFDYVISSLRLLSSVLSFHFMTPHIKVKQDSMPFLIDKYIKEHFHEQLTYKNLCDKFNIGRTACYTIIKDLYGLGLKEEINFLRIEKAKDLLKNATLSIAKVSLYCGIDDYNYFSKVFKKAVGVSPSDYRRKAI